MPDEIKKDELKQPEGTIKTSDNGKDEKKEPQKPEPPVTDFKVAEIWIRSGNVMIDATEAFWQDRCRALGLLDLCKDIVKTAQAPKNKIIPVKGNFLNGIRNLKNSFRRR